MKKFFALAFVAVSFLLASCSVVTNDGSLMDPSQSALNAAYGDPAVILDSARSRLVNLGSAVLIGTVEGEVEVENLSSTKSVVVHYTLDNVNWQDVNAYYRKSTGNNREIWAFSVELFETDYVYYPASKSIRFAVKMTANGQTFWDNNGGADYRVSTRGSDQIYSLVALGKKAVRLEHGHYGSVYPAGTVLDLEVAVKNLGYAKEVNVVYTTDKWLTTKVAKGFFAKIYDAKQEKWVISTVISAYNPGSSDNSYATEVEFALAYKVNGITYWDNNNGQNYLVTAGGDVE
jgi:hypothetical protein